MIVILLRKSVRPIVEMSMPSMMILPSVASTNRKNESASVLFPEPVLPNTPIYAELVRSALTVVHNAVVPFRQDVPQSSGDVARREVQA